MLDLMTVVLSKLFTVKVLFGLHRKLNPIYSIAEIMSISLFLLKYIKNDRVLTFVYQNFDIVTTSGGSGCGMGIILP